MINSPNHLQKEGYMMGHESSVMSFAFIRDLAPPAGISDVLGRSAARPYNSYHFFRSGPSSVDWMLSGFLLGYFQSKICNGHMCSLPVSHPVTSALGCSLQQPH